MFIVKYRFWFFVLSGVLVGASLVAFLAFGLKPGIDFTGGTLIEVTYENPPEKASLESAIRAQDIGAFSVRQEGDSGYILRTRVLSESERSELLSTLAPEGSGAELGRLASVGPTIGTELARKSFTALGLVILGIVLYIAFVFRKVSRPVSSWMYGLIAVVTLVHDVVIPIGVFSWLGSSLGIEIDALFVAALLTVLGFSVHDTIVVFDRVRENLRINEKEEKGEEFQMTVGKSLQQTYVRSINTSFTVIIVLLALFFLGGASTEDFTLALLIGIITGTYSSICLASPLLVTAEKMQQPKVEKSKKKK